MLFASSFESGGKGVLESSSPGEVIEFSSPVDSVRLHVEFLKKKQKKQIQCAIQRIQMASGSFKKRRDASASFCFTFQGWFPSAAPNLLVSSCGCAASVRPARSTSPWCGCIRFCRALWCNKKWPVNRPPLCCPFVGTSTSIIGTQTPNKSFYIPLPSAKPLQSARLGKEIEGNVPRKREQIRIAK